jgi:hypothetical protein
VKRWEDSSEPRPLSTSMALILLAAFCLAAALVELAR